MPSHHISKEDAALIEDGKRLRKLARHSFEMKHTRRKDTSIPLSIEIKARHTTRSNSLTIDSLRDLLDRMPDTWASHGAFHESKEPEAY